MSASFEMQAKCWFRAGDANLQRYVTNNPTNLTDPSGLAPLPKKQLTGSKEVQAGEFEWEIKVPDLLGKAVEARFWFKPKREGAKAEAISFIQVVHVRTLGADAYYPGTDAQESYYKLFSTDPKKANMLDHKLSEDDPYFGVKWDGKQWVDEGVTGQLGGKKEGKTATLIDGLSFNRDGRQGKVAYVSLETAAFCIDSQEVLAVFNWGFTVPANKTDPIVLFDDTDYDGKQFSLRVSEPFKKLVQKANQVVYEGKKVLLTPVTAPNRSKLNCGGTSALPDK